MSGAGGGGAERSPRFALVAFHLWLAITAGWWALAFAPLPVPPDWLARARAVCFGTLPSGLPETWGWGLLLLAPLSLLGFLLAVWGRDLAAGLAALWRRPLGRTLVVALALGVLGGVSAVGARVAGAARARAALGAVPARPFPAELERGTEPAPELVLVDQRGERFDLAELRGRAVLVSFAYGHCPTICPMLIETLRRATAAAGPQPPPVVVVTLDPWRDTPGALPGIARSWRLEEIPGARLLSGEIETVERTIREWGVDSARDPRTGEITHAAFVFVVDAEGRLAYRFLSPPAGWLVEATRTLGHGA